MNIINLHYLNPFHETVDRFSTANLSVRFNTLFTYKNLRIPETDVLFRKVIDSKKQDTLRGFLSLAKEIVLHGGGGQYSVLVHQSNYLGPYAPLFLILLLKRGRYEVSGPDGLNVTHTRKDAIRILKTGILFSLNRLKTMMENIQRLRGIPFESRIRLKRRYPMPDRVPFPRIALIEPTNLCNLRCPVCETGNGSIARNRAMMRFEDFRIIMEKLPASVEEICLHINGESFLNKDIYSMIAYAAEKNYKTYLDTNGLLFDPLKVVASGLDEITVCLDGDSPESYVTYRVGGDYHRLLANIEGLVKAKKNADSKKPRLVLKTIAMKHTDHLIDTLKPISRRFGADSCIITCFTARTSEEALKYQSDRSRFSKYIPSELKKGCLTTRYVPSVRECQIPYYAVNVTATGDVIPCCRDMEGDYVMGNLINDDFKDIWNRYEFSEFRRSLLSEPASICSECHLAVNNTLY